MDLMNNKLQKTVHLEKVDARLQFLLNTEDERVVKFIQDCIGLDPTNYVKCEKISGVFWSSLPSKVCFLKNEVFKCAVAKRICKDISVKSAKVFSTGASLFVCYFL